MHVVIFRAKIRTVDAEYSRVAARMRDLALREFGCLEFHAVSEGDDEIALSYWPDEESIRQWKAHPEHVLAQKAGRERWYESYSVEVAEITRQYRVPSSK
jgi:heme-degrading monooxygenase HmoA